MKKIAALAATAALLATPAFAATKHHATGNVCTNVALSKSEKSDCKTALSHAKSKADKAKVKEEYAQKVAAARHK